MSVVVFCGPSLGHEDGARFPGVSWRPPAEAGDLLALLPDAPRLTVCLVDGYFDHRPAVRHKELLLLLSEGTRILGAGSMGALRAAEMDGFGLEGVGAVYRAYASGRLTGDDEVALAHGPSEWHWRPLSVPLVEVRATLCALARRRRIAVPEARTLLNAASAVHYSDRTWESFAGDRAALLAEAHVPLKRLDALSCLAAAYVPPPPRPRPAPVRTSFLRALARERGIPLGELPPTPG
jgi:hypothetical protein